MAVGYRFPILNSDGSPSDTIVDMDDMFVSADTFYEKGLYAWGEGTNGVLGDGTTASKSSPVQIGTLTNWKQVSAGSVILAVKIDGTLWAWGDGTRHGALGDSTIVSKSSPVQIGTLTNWKQVAAGSEDNSAAIKTDGTLWTWGEGSNGALGDSTIVSKSSPVQIGLLTNWKQVASGARFAAAIKTDGTLWAWGRNSNGQIGDNTTIDKSSPVQVGLLTDWKQVDVGHERAGQGFTLAVKTDGTLWAWGDGSSGALGDGTTASKSSPVQIGLLTNWKQVAGGIESSAAIKTDGTLWTWGDNAAGQLGDGTRINRSSPVQIGLLTNWKQVSGGGDGTSREFKVALKNDGTLWTWGNNEAGQLGDGTTASKSSPVQIGTLTNWKQFDAGWESSQAISSSDY